MPGMTRGKPRPCEFSDVWHGNCGLPECKRDNIFWRSLQGPFAFAGSIPRDNI